jgi:hypothetical protein
MVQGQARQIDSSQDITRAVVELPALQVQNTEFKSQSHKKKKKRCPKKQGKNERA